MSNKEKLVRIFCEVFKVEEDQAANLEFGGQNWDSIGHLQMIGELENKFGISVSPDDIVKMGTFGDVVKVLEESYGVVFE